ncbi:hypothetical protein E4U43_003995 [Claviceps pusilla]|uniref:Uncharacterized protein n=1 Tax=Claviceps pusilla TaxID=123648 RepID=A0A9P7N4P7_9HYPO|nr:hypothetical protein E4U43_003995 [Claviceps pusilla]
MRVVSFVMACLATASMAAPIRDQLAAPRVGGRDAAAQQSTFDNGWAPRPCVDERREGGGNQESFRNMVAGLGNEVDLDEGWVGLVLSSNVKKM